MNNPFVGYKYIKRGTKDGGILLEIWRDESLENDKEKPKWVKIYSKLQKEKGWRSRPSDHQYGDFGTL